MNDMHTDIHRLEAELNIVIYPGTEVMTDVHGVEFVKGGSGVLVPQPSNDPTDPLNWTNMHKMGAVYSGVLLGFVQGFGPLSLASQVPFYIQEFDITVNQVINLIGVTILDFFWVPVATQFGRRPCAILSMAVCMASMIWRAEANSYHSFLGACILNGFGAGPSETLPPMIISDVIFLHQRGRYNVSFFLHNGHACFAEALRKGLYWWAYFGSLMVGPVVAGTMSDKYGWRRLPETKFDRNDGVPAAPVRDPNVVKDAGSKEHIEDEIIEKHVDDQLGRGRPAAWQYNPLQKFSGSKASLLRDIITPWTLFCFPIVQWTSFAVSFSSSCFLVLNLTQSFVFSAPPYSFSSQSVGFTNLAVFGGALIGLVTAGPLGDFMSARSTKRNGLIREPEMRLPALWPFVIVLVIGSAIVATGYQNGADWKLIVILGYGAIGWQVASIPPIAITYAIDAYKPVSGDLLVAVTVNKNLWGYGVSQFLIPWILADPTKPDFIQPIMVNTGLTVAFVLLGSIALLFGGKKVRGWTKNSYVHHI
ncbi:hypothetical protein RQP46_003047 [Phenoliferia psychrophenolica]